MLPLLGGVMPSIISTVVVLPAPFGPRSPKQTPLASSKLTPSTARTPGYCLTRSRTSMSAAIGAGCLARAAASTRCRPAPTRLEWPLDNLGGAMDRLGSLLRIALLGLLLGAGAAQAARDV